MLECNNLPHFVDQTKQPIHSCKMTSNPILKQIHTNSYCVTASRKRVAGERCGSHVIPDSFVGNDASSLIRRPTHMERAKKSNSHSGSTAPFLTQDPDREEAAHKLQEYYISSEFQHNSQA